LIIFDEKKYAENLILNGYKNKKYINSDNIILVKYWKYVGLSEKQIQNNLKNFMNEFQELYSANIVENKVSRAMNIGMQYDLYTDIKITILDKELELINNLESLELRKLMFILLVVWKFKGKPQRFKINNIDLLRLSEVKVNNNVFWDYIYKITQTQMLSMVVYQNKDYYTVNMDLDGEVILNIDNFNNPIYYYLNLIEPDKFKCCEECGELIKITSNRKKYCTTCWKEKEKLLKRDWKRNNIKVEV